MEDYSMLLKLIENLGKQQNSFPDSVTLGQAHKAIEDLTAEIKDKDYLIQQQADEIERLRRDVKKQHEKMIELAKKLPKRSQWTNLRISMDGTSSVECVLCGATIHKGFTQEPNYCPNCGAMMAPMIVERKEEKE